MSHADHWKLVFDPGGGNKIFHAANKLQHSLLPRNAFANVPALKMATGVDAG